jgi:hypothetical protein
MANKDVNMGTGYCTHELYSDNNSVLVVPLAYSVEGERVVGCLNENGKLADIRQKDIAYINECIKLSDKDIAGNVKERVGRENAVNRKKFFEKILEGLVK